MTCHPPKSSAAFSLVEVLIVIGIIATLAVLLVPSLDSMRNRAQQARCASNLRQIGSALLQYAGENNGALPPGRTWDREISPYFGIADWNVKGAHTTVLTCPMDKRTGPLASEKYPRSYTSSQIKPADPTQGVFGDDVNFTSRRLSAIPRPGSTIVIFEYFTDATGKPIGNEQFMQAYGYSAGYQSTASLPRLANGRYYHGSAFNYLFADGHVEAMPPAVVFTPPNNSWRATTTP